VALLATTVAGVLAVAGVVAGTLSAGRPAARAAATVRRAKPAPVVPLQVLSVTEGGGVRQTNGAAPLQVTLSTPLAATSPLPTVHPAVAGSWTRSGTTLTFTPAAPFPTESVVHVGFAAGQSGLRSAAGGVLAAPVLDWVHTGNWSTLRVQQLLAQLGYLPLQWVPQPGTAVPLPTMAAQIAAAYSPPAGSFKWDRGYPTVLTTFWGGPSSMIMNGAIRAFQYDRGLTMDGQITPGLWQDLMRAAVKDQRNPNGYSYALASKVSPETLTVWHNGQVVLHTLANTGIPVSPTADGTYPVYLRYHDQIMRGTNPDGTKYADPVSFVAYFNGGDAVHYYPRYSFGSPQSLGCVELPYAQAAHVWPYLTYGTLVTVSG
jgi:peptidoglycan hydrolase-like protein with peptidoglycan-binding domain